jgi:hypothetical protein
MSVACVINSNLKDMVKSIITTVLVFICAVSYGQDIKTFKKDNISFDYPVSWVKRDFPQYYILVSEPPKEQMSVMTTFDVAVEEGHKSLLGFCKSYENQISTNEQFQDFRIKSKQEIEFKGLKTMEYHCSAKIQHLSIEWKSLVFMKEGKVYKLSTTSLTEQFELLKETTEKIFDSFEIE